MRGIKLVTLKGYLREGENGGVFLDFCEYGTRAGAGVSVIDGADASEQRVEEIGEPSVVEKSERSEEREPVATEQRREHKKAVQESGELKHTRIKPLLDDKNVDLQPLVFQFLVIIRVSAKFTFSVSDCHPRGVDVMRV